ncbi:MAG: hypothetical protein KF841_09185 [Phycisphaerae bacterium]|nr:hypothetical protein [Phycisphaerae bacterium]
MKASRLVLIALCVGFIAGCVPEKRIVWTADGRTGAVVSDRGVFLIDANGRPLPGRAGIHALRATWCRDGSGLLIVSQITVNTWEEVSAVLTDAQKQHVIETAQVVKPRILAHEGDWDHFEMTPNQDTPGGLLAAVLVYIRDKDPEGMREKLGDKWKSLTEIKPNVCRLDLYKRDGDQLTFRRRLVNSLDEISCPASSPDDQFVAFNMDYWSGAEEMTGRALQIVGLEAGTPRPVAIQVASGLDWSPDGRHLAYVRSSVRRKESEAVLQLGSLATIRVRNDQGELLKEWTEQIDRAGLLYNPMACVKWLRDGRLLFVSVEMTLPATQHDMPRQWSIFAVDPRVAAGLSRVLARDFDAPINAAIGWFEVSPDESRVLIPCEHGQVAIYNMATAETQLLLPSVNPQADVKSLPTWRDNSEVWLVDPGSAPANPEVVIWKAGKIRPISENWPNELREGWIGHSPAGSDESKATPDQQSTKPARQ